MLWLYLDKYRPAKFFIFIYFFKFYILNKSKKEQKHHSVFFYILCKQFLKYPGKRPVQTIKFLLPLRPSAPYVSGARR